MINRGYVTYKSIRILELTIKRTYLDIVDVYHDDVIPSALPVTRIEMNEGIMRPVTPKNDHLNSNLL